MKSNEQIKELTYLIKGSKCEGNCNTCSKCIEYRSAETVYRAGYRKMDKGEKSQ